jgi:hypothetical protein
LSNTVYFVDTTYKQYEIARLIERLDRELLSHESRLHEVQSKTNSLPPILPFKQLDIPNDSPAIGHFTRKMDLTPTSGLINESASNIAALLQRSIEAMIVTPAMIKKEHDLSEREKLNLAEVRKLTNDTLTNLLRGNKVLEVSVDGLRLLKQDGEIFDVEMTINQEKDVLKVRSKISVLPNGSFAVHQLGDYPNNTCEKIAKHIAGTVDLALDRVYASQFSICRENRLVEGWAIVDNKRVTLERTMCG